MNFFLFIVFTLEIFLGKKIMLLYLSVYLDNICYMVMVFAFIFIGASLHCTRTEKLASVNESTSGNEIGVYFDHSNCTTHECSGECTFCFKMYFALRKGDQYISLPIYGCGGPGHVAAKHLSISIVPVEEEQECKNVTSSPDQKDLVNLVLEKMSNEINKHNISDRLEVQMICSKSEVEIVTEPPTTTKELETETSAYESPASGITDPSKRPNGYCQAILSILIGTITSNSMIARLLPCKS